MRGSDGFGLRAGFGVRLAGEEQRVVLDYTWKRLKALVHGQGHGCSGHLTNHLSRKRKRDVKHMRFLCFAKHLSGL